MAPKADLRPFQIAALSVADCEMRRVDGLKASAIVGDPADQIGDLRLGALDLDDQQRLDVERIAGMGEGLADLDRRPVHVFDRDRNDAGADDRRDAGAGGLGRLEAHQHRPRAFGGAQDAHASPR